MKAELKNIIVDLERKYDALNTECIDECAKNYMSRRATYLDGQLAMLHEVIEMLDDINSDLETEEALEYFDESDFDFELDDDVDETNYNPYCGCEDWCD